LLVTGRAGPLLFARFLSVGHTIGAAAAASALIAATARTHLGWRGLGVVAGVVVAVLVRTEALLFAGALAAVLVVAAWRWRQAGLAVLGGAAILAAGAARVAESLMIRHVLGRADSSIGVPARSGGKSLVAGRWEGFVTTWLQPTARDLKVAAFCVILVAVAMAVAAWIARRRPSDIDGLRLFAGIAVVASLARLVAAPPDPVPGLIMAFPVGVVGVLLISRRSLSRNGSLLVATAALFALAVLATQYPEGGSAEWGGRYFALAVPLVATVAVVS